MPHDGFLTHMLATSSDGLPACVDRDHTHALSGRLDEIIRLCGDSHLPYSAAKKEVALALKMLSAHALDVTETCGVSDERDLKAAVVRTFWSLGDLISSDE